MIVFAAVEIDKRFSWSGARPASIGVNRKRIAAFRSRWNELLLP